MNPAAKTETVLPLAVFFQLTENPHLGHQLPTAALYPGITIANSNTASGLRVCLYDSGRRSRSTGKERDAESGLDFFDFRYLSGAQGRFTSPDDPSLIGDPSNPQSWNLFSYGWNNPLRYSDPSGHEPCENGVNPENGNICTVVTAQPPATETNPSPLPPLILDVLITSVQVVQQTQQILQPMVDWFSRPRSPLCMAGYTGAGASIGFWAGGGLGSLGLAGGPVAAATIPGGAAGGSALVGGIGGLGGMIMCSSGTGEGGGNSGGGGGQPASEKTAQDMAKQIERDLGKDARRAFHDAKEGGVGDRTLAELKADAKALYEEFGKTPPKWMQ